MNIVISIHVFPNELDRYEVTLKRLNLCLNGIFDNVALYTTLNISSANIDWSNSSLNKENSIERYYEINNQLSGAKKINKITTTNTSYGVNHHRRETYRKFYAYDAIIYLDSDVVFSTQILKNYIKLLNSFDYKNNWYVISPQTVRLWDTTWDCLVNEKYIKEYLNSHRRLNAEEVISSTKEASRSLRELKTHKFAGGWFTAYSPKLLNYVGIPDSFGSYGPDDTFLMACMNLMKNSGMSVIQYVIENEIIIEDLTTDVSGLSFTSNPSQQRLIGQQNFISELRQFSKKL